MGAPVGPSVRMDDKGDPLETPVKVCLGVAGLVPGVVREPYRPHTPISHSMTKFLDYIWTKVKGQLTPCRSIQGRVAVR